MTTRLVTALTALAAVAALAAGAGALFADNLTIPVTWHDGATAVGDDEDYLVGGATTSTMTITAPTAGQRSWVFVPAVAWCLTAVACGVLLRRVVRTIDAGDVFHPANPRRLALLGSVVLAGGLLAAALATAGNLQLAGDLPADASIPGVGAVDPSGEIVFPSTALAIAATLWLVAALLRRGAAMREELRGLV